MQSVNTNILFFCQTVSPDGGLASKPACSNRVGVIVRNSPVKTSMLHDFYTFIFSEA